MSASTPSRPSSLWSAAVARERRLCCLQCPAMSTPLRVVTRLIAAFEGVGTTSVAPALPINASYNGAHGQIRDGAVIYDRSHSGVIAAGVALVVVVVSLSAPPSPYRCQTDERAGPVAPFPVRRQLTGRRVSAKRYAAKSRPTEQLTYGWSEPCSAGLITVGGQSAVGCHHPRQERSERMTREPLAPARERRLVAWRSARASLRLSSPRESSRRYSPTYVAVGRSRCQGLSC
uniref:Uncharacterized protein n=1 Tax=Plectus sambesii TaxID=2011161 RepID=A0A914WVS7_9BILA